MLLVIAYLCSDSFDEASCSNFHILKEVGVGGRMLGKLACDV